MDTTSAGGNPQPPLWVARLSLAAEFAVVALVTMVPTFAVAESTTVLMPSTAQLAVGATTAALQIALILAIWRSPLRRAHRLLSPQLVQRPADLLRVSPTQLIGFTAVAAAVALAVAGITTLFCPDAGSVALPSTLPAWPVVLMAVVVAAFREELLFRAYVTDRLAAMGLPTAGAVCVGSVLFALGHRYQGVCGVGVALITGLVYAILWVRGAPLAALTLGHALYNAVVVYTAATSGGYL